MKRLFKIFVLPFVVLACKLPGNDQNANNEPGSTNGDGPAMQVMTSEFPAFELDQLVEEVSQEELAAVINDGESDNWKRTNLDVNSGEIAIQNKLATDNSVTFKLYGRSPSVAMIAVQQQNAQVEETEIWEYRFEVNEDHPERWSQYSLPDYKLDNFYDDRVVLPADFHGESAKPYLDFELQPASIVVSLNKWTYMRDLEADSIQSGGPIDPTLIKYMYSFKWNGVAFDEERITEAGYTEALTFTSYVVENDEDGPGPHEFDCGHGVSVTTSSTLPKQGAYSYNAKNLTDDSNGTAWAEGVAGDGEGEWIEFTITSDFLIGQSWQIGNGYNRSKDVWQQNGRVKKMNVLVDDKLIGYVMLANVSAYQSFNISPSWLKDSPAYKKGTRIRFVIGEVYQGSKYDDTMISFFVPTGNCG